MDCGTVYAVRVSIPSSSGHQFTGFSLWNAGTRLPVPFQSLLHQGISLLTRIRVRYCAYTDPFQSLLHQGISLLVDCGSSPRRTPWPSVSIPSSSGHQFTVFWSINSPQSGCPHFVSIPSSSGHQFTAKAACNARPRRRRRFNPFFIRASVYCQDGN